MTESPDRVADADGAMFLIGAGFTKALLPRAPLNQELLAVLMEHGAPVLRRYADCYKEHDIERLLTRIDLDCGPGSAISEEDRVRLIRDRKAIDEEIAAYFRSFRLGNPDNEVPAGSFGFATTLLKPGDCVVSLNYDCVLEGLLDVAGVWTPNGGYGRIENILAGDSLPLNPRAITVFKLHGSENFVQSRLMRGDEVRQTVIGLEIDERLYPNSSKNHHYGGGMWEPERYIIAPSFVKVPHVAIAALMLDVEDRVANCRHFTVIGCSLRREDSFLWLLLTRFLNRQLSKPMSLTIVDPNPEPIMERLRGYWIGDIDGLARVTLLSGSWLDELPALIRTLDSARVS